MMSSCISRLLLGLLLVTLNGCASWLGSGDVGGHPTVYAPATQIVANPAWPQVNGVLLIAHPSAAPMLDSRRIVVRPAADELQLLRGARWARPAPEMLQETLLHLLEDSGKLRAVARQSSGIAGNWRLLLDIRRFEADYSQGPIPTVELVVNAKLVAYQEQQIIASQTFTHSQTAHTSTTGAIMTAFSQGLSQVTGQLTQWVLESASETQ